MYPNTQTKPHYRASSAAAQRFWCTGTSCTCYTNVSAPFYSAPGGKKEIIKKKLQVTNACAHQGCFPFLFSFFLFLNVQIHSGHAESCSRRSSSSVCKQNVRVHGRTYVRARGTNAHARTHTRARTHRRIYRWPIYARSDYGLIAGRHSRGSEFVSSTSGASDAATVAPVVLKTRGGGGGDDRLLMLIVLALLQDLASKWYQLDAGPVSAIPIPC